MPTNDFLPFGTAVGANVMAQADYLALTARSNGFSAGTAASAQLNKAWRQASIMASMLAQFIVDQSGQNATDDGTTATLEANLLIAIRAAGRQATVLVDTGAANAYAAANTPALAALPTTSGYSQRVNIANANTGAATYAPDGLAAKPIYGLALQPLQGGELPAGIAVLMYLVQSGVNGGNGAWIIIESLGGAQQILAATRSLHAVNAGQIQAQALTAFTTAGTAPAFTLTPVPAITAYATNQRFQVTFNAAGGATPTLNVSGLGAKNLKQYTSAGAKIAAIIAASQTSDVVYDGTDLVVLDQLPNSVGTTPAQFDNSTNLATTSFVRGVGLQFSNSYVVSANTTLTAATHAGSLVVGSSSSAITITLPASSTMPLGTAIKFWNYGAAAMSLVPSGSDTITTPQAVSALTVPQGIYFTLVSTGSTGWYVVDGAPLVGITGSFKNLLGSATGTSASVSYTADELTVRSASNMYQTLRSVSISPSLSASGVNGLDTGTSAANTWYNVWVIFNGTTTAGLFSLSATAPTLPTGYSMGARVGAVRSDSTANKYPLSFVQAGRRAQYKVAAGSNVATTPIIASGTQGNPTSPTWIGIPWASFAPPTASSLRCTVHSATQTTSIMAAPNASYGAWSSATSVAPLLSSSPNGLNLTINSTADIIIESSNIYCSSNDTGGSLAVIGWEDNL